MPKFSGRTATGVARRATALSPVRSDLPSVTHEGGEGYLRDAKSELFLLAVANMVGEDTFYEAGLQRDSRFRSLVKTVTLEDPAWVAGLVPYLRTEMYLRSAPLVMAAEYALALREAIADAKCSERETSSRHRWVGNVEAPGVRSVINSALQRPDEPAEFIGYWLQRTGSHTLPGGIQRGVADAVSRLYGEYAALKYDGGERGIRMGDVIEMAHPTPVASWQSDLFTYLLDRRHNSASVRASLEELPMVRARRALQEVPVESRREWLRWSGSQEVLRVAGMTWEDLSGWVNGPLDASVWEAIIPSMGYMALLRNLRNFEQAGVSQDTVAAVCSRLADPTQVAKSKQFPFRFLSAYKNVNSLQWAPALETALNHSVANVPALPGRTLILLDCSGSMWHDRVSKLGDAWRYEVAGLFAFALALRAANATTVFFGADSTEFTVPKGASVLPLVKRLHDMGGTYTATAAARHFDGHDRVIVLTDGQSHDGDPGRSIPANVPLYSFDVAGYRVGHESGTPYRHTFGGLSDKAFAAIPLLERGVSQQWPWLKG